MEDSEDESAQDFDEKTNMYSILIPKHSQIQFSLKFTPYDAESFLFDMPMIIEGIDHGIPEIQRPISGEGSKSNFELEHRVIDFKNKVVTSGEKTFADHKNTIISSSDLYPLKWRADTDSLKKNNVFSM